MWSVTQAKSLAITNDLKSPQILKKIDRSYDSIEIQVEIIP